MEKEIKYNCLENDNQIRVFYEDGIIGELWFGHESGVGGWIVIGYKDLLNVIKQAENESTTI